MPGANSIIAKVTVPASLSGVHEVILIAGSALRALSERWRNKIY